MNDKSSKEMDELEQIIITVIAGLCIVAEYYYGGASVNFMCVSVILLAILLCLFQIWNKLESIRYMMDYRFEKDFITDNADVIDHAASRNLANSAA